MRNNIMETAKKIAELKNAFIHFLGRDLISQFHHENMVLETYVTNKAYGVNKENPYLNKLEETLRKMLSEIYSKNDFGDFKGIDIAVDFLLEEFRKTKD